LVFRVEYKPSAAAKVVSHMLTRSKNKTLISLPTSNYVPKAAASDDTSSTKSTPSSSGGSLKRQSTPKEPEAVKIQRSDVIPFVSCLTDTDNLPPDCGHHPVLARSLSSRELNDEGWLSSPFMDIVFDRFAKSYSNVHFMSSDFAALSLASKDADSEYSGFTDILGSKISKEGNEDDTKDIVFVCNSNGIHWNLMRVVRRPYPELQLFEPMGKPTLRRGGLDKRSIPKGLIAWLDACYPFEKSWLTVGISAITSQQQFTTYDCGVACLLYAEKCGLQQASKRVYCLSSF
jgi:hypothetical protein